MSNRQLAPLPSGIRALTNPDVIRLRQQYPNLWADPSKSCITCNFEETGTKTLLVRPTPGTAPVLYDCACADQWLLHRWMLNAGVDIRYQRLSWVDCVSVPGSIQVAVAEYVDHISSHMAKGSGLTLWSPHRGTGKTLLSTLLFKHVLAKGHDGYFIQFNEMLDAFSAGWRNEDERAWFVRRVRNAALLVVDDMGRENRGRAGIAESMFDTVIRARVAGARPTIITTNWTAEEMLQGYGPNVLSLLSEVNTPLEVPGADYRPTSRAQDIQDTEDNVRRPLVMA